MLGWPEIDYMHSLAFPEPPKLGISHSGGESTPCDLNCYRLHWRSLILESVVALLGQLPLSLQRVIVEDSSS